MREGVMDYRSHVGQPQLYDQVAAMSFNLLTCLGLREVHTLLDVGCGSLRCGRLFIPYLNKGKYVGVEPNAEVLHEGISNEVGADLIKIKEPAFHIRSDLPPTVKADYALAHSIFSHTGIDLFEKWMHDINANLTPTGILLATMIVGEDATEQGWVYPGTTFIPLSAIHRIAEECQLTAKRLAFAHTQTSVIAEHPQQWFAFTKDNTFDDLLDNISWRNYVEQKAKGRL